MGSRGGSGLGGRRGGVSGARLCTGRRIWTTRRTNNAEENLAVLSQKCRNGYDGPKRAATVAQVLIMVGMIWLGKRRGK